MFPLRSSQATSCRRGPCASAEPDSSLACAAVRLRSRAEVAQKTLDATDGARSGVRPVAAHKAHVDGRGAADLRLSDRRAARGAGPRRARQAAIVALPKRFPDREEIAAVRAEAEELEPGSEGKSEHRVAGRILARRDMGNLMFLDLVDWSGRIQLLVRPVELGGVDLDLGDIVGVSWVAA